MADLLTTLPYQLYVGVDIALASFTSTWQRPGSRPTSPRTFLQTPDGFAAFQRELVATSVTPAATLIVLAATSSYWVALAVTLHQAGFIVSVINPTKVHHFAKSLPRRGKSDPLDADLLTRFAVERTPEPWTPPPAVYHELRQRLTARDALLSMRQQARNQLHALLQWPVVVAEVQKQMENVIAGLDVQLVSLDRGIAQVLADGAWAASAAWLQGVQGIGMLTAAWLLVTTVNFTTCASAEAAATMPAWHLWSACRVQASAVGRVLDMEGTDGCGRRCIWRR